MIATVLCSRRLIAEQCRMASRVVGLPGGEEGGGTSFRGRTPNAFSSHSSAAPALGEAEGLAPTNDSPVSRSYDEMRLVSCCYRQP